MKIRSLSALLVLVVATGGAVAGEAVCAASQEAAPAQANRPHGSLGIQPVDEITDVDVALVARSAMNMPACGSCHGRQ